jgi:hypothetical protein
MTTTPDPRRRNTARPFRRFRTGQYDACGNTASTPLLARQSMSLDPACPSNRAPQALSTSATCAIEQASPCTHPIRRAQIPIAHAAFVAPPHPPNPRFPPLEVFVRRPTVRAAPPVPAGIRKPSQQRSLTAYFSQACSEVLLVLGYQIELIRHPAQRRS